MHHSVVPNTRISSSPRGHPKATQSRGNLYQFRHIRAMRELRTTLMSEGLDKKQPYRMHEEEVLRVGTHVLQSFQRARWTDGRVFIWLGVRKLAGRGEGHSGLAFDRIVPTPGADRERS
jgi:hypothetical protein